MNCAKYIKKMLKCKPKDIYVNRTILKEHKMSDISEVAVYVKLSKSRILDVTYYCVV